MSKWLEFTDNYDHVWPSRAVTAFKKGMKTYVKREVFEAAFAAGVAHETDKPDDGEPAYLPTPTRFESRNRRLRGNPVTRGGALARAGNVAGPTAPEETLDLTETPEPPEPGDGKLSEAGTGAPAPGPTPEAEQEA